VSRIIQALGNQCLPDAQTSTFLQQEQLSQLANFFTAIEARNTTTADYVALNDRDEIKTGASVAIVLAHFRDFCVRRAEPIADCTVLFTDLLDYFADITVVLWFYFQYFESGQLCSWHILYA